MNRKQASNFLPAPMFAEALGRPLNLFVTLNFHHTACPPEEVGAAFERLRDNHFTRWFRYHTKRVRRLRGPVPPTYVWTIENVAGHTHVHWLVHIPPILQQAFREKLPQWLEAVAGPVTIETSAVHVEPAERPAGLSRYMMKGIDPRYAKFYRIDHEPQGVVHGKRCGVSECLGPAARARHRACAMAA